MFTFRFIICTTLLAGGAATGAAKAARDTPVSKVIELLESLLAKTEFLAKAEGRTYEEFACFCKNMTKSKSDAALKGTATIELLSAGIEDHDAEKEIKGKELIEAKATKDANVKALQETKNEYAAGEAAYHLEAADLAKALSSLESAKASLVGAGGTDTKIVPKPVFQDEAADIDAAAAEPEKPPEPAAAPPPPPPVEPVEEPDFSKPDSFAYKSCCLPNGGGTWMVPKNTSDADCPPCDFLFLQESLESAKPAAASLLETFRQTLRVAEAMGMVKRRHKKVVSALLQKRMTVDPDLPDYAFHSQGIIDLIDDLIAKFTAKKTTADADWAQAQENFQATIAQLSSRIKFYDTRAINELEEDISDLTTSLAKGKKDLTRAQFAMKDDKLYLTDLTDMCEKRAKEWDQRSKMRGEEIDTLKKAMSILTKRVAPTDTSREIDEAPDEPDNMISVPRTDFGVEPETFFQARSVRSHRAHSFLSQREQSGVAAESRKKRVVATLDREGQRLQSMALISLASHASKDPFVKVKVLIQKLIERLVAEAEGEATKKGFCDEEMGKKMKDRDYRYGDVMELNAEIAQLEAKDDKLEMEIDDLTETSKHVGEDLDEATKIRADEKKQNAHLIELGEEGYKAVVECIDLLKTFYRKASRAFLQVSPVDEDTLGAGFEGHYKGQQTSMRSIIGLLEVIKSDYERSVRRTTEEEKQAHADFVLFKRQGESDLSGKGTKHALDSEDLANTKVLIKSKMADLQTQMNLLDKALQEMANLNPMCVDSGMSHEERVARRDAEIVALKKALCQLDSEGEELDCQL